jgi:hypothetical protein
MPRLRQAVLAARDLDATVARLRDGYGLGEPFRDPAVEYFGLANAVFAIGDTFLEVVSPVRADASAARQLDRQGADVCGYMAMLQVDDLAAARERVRDAGVREVFEIVLDDISEVHLHPADVGGAIVSLSQPQPAAAWRWGGEDWHARSVPGAVTGVTVAVGDPDAVAARWAALAGGAPAGCTFVADPAAPGIVAIELELGGERCTLAVSRVHTQGGS